MGYLTAFPAEEVLTRLMGGFSSTHRVVPLEALSQGGAGHPPELHDAAVADRIPVLVIGGVYTREWGAECRHHIGEAQVG
ncbi:hypothetical protein [Nocardia gipuzkoensis]|uniref:hypothetical protein n=1 Tax=Nocardia gipuzkoensis TaxID=2749991 RepID=UPI003EDEA61C